MNLTFSPAGLEDIPPLIALNRELIEAWEDPDAIDLGMVLAWVERKITRHLDAYTRIVLEDQTVGYFRLCPGENETELDDFYLLPPFRGRGIGTAVLRRCIARTRTPMTLCVFTGNTGAIRLYTRMGFVVTEHISPTRCLMRREVP